MSELQAVDLDSTWGRLQARNEALERQLEALLRRTGLSRAVLLRAAHQAGHTDPRRLAEARLLIEAQPDVVPAVSFEQISRPSPTLDSQGRAGRWLRV